MEYRIAQENLKLANLVIEPKVEARNIDWGKFVLPERLIDSGEQAVMEKLPQIERLLSQLAGP